ncbi:hypothetical protein SDC9_40321 [bioreactor metagenome]|uniref:Uncharacterized protein n=1 Tax=bioreactor metagenome TaxID=1076179 RepID=A0A644VUY4_9ZZZZ
MSKSYRLINIFVSHPFEPKNDTYDLKSFRTNIELIVKDAENEVRKEYQDFDLDITFEFSDFQDGLPKQILNSIRKSHFAIVDITENKPNIFFEFGLLKGFNVPTLLIKARKSFDNFHLPADIKDEIAHSYDSFEELRRKCTNIVVILFKQLLNSDTLYNVHLNKIWFPNNPDTIHVIGPPETEKSQYASPISKNYIFLNNLGDIDSILEVMNFLNRNYRNIKLPIYSADEFKNHIEDNLMVLGGPGESDEDGNIVCALLMDKMNVKVSYSFAEEDELMVYKDQKFSATYRGGKVIKDYGYFARFPNPFNPKSSVVLIHGIHTFGVLGAAKAFSDHPSAQGNIRKVMKKLTLDDIKQASFECFFPVDVLQQSVVCPDIDEDYILPLSKK